MDSDRIDLVAEGTVGISKALEITDLGRSSLYQEMNRGEIPYIKAGRRRLIPLRGLKEYLARRVVGGSSGHGVDRPPAA